MIELPGEAHRAGEVVWADHDGVEAGMGQDGVELFHGADVFDLRDKEDVLRHVHAIGIEIPAVHVGAGIAHAPAAARVGVQRETDGPVKLLAGFVMGKTSPCAPESSASLMGRSQPCAMRAKGVEPPRSMARNTSGRMGPRERAVFHVHSHPVVTGMRPSLPQRPPKGTGATYRSWHCPRAS